MNLLGLARSPRFSPNSTARDEAILNAVAGELRRMGHHVRTVCEEEDFCAEPYDRIFNMARGENCLHRLARTERQGTPIFNSAEALLRNSRSYLTRIFEHYGIPTPESRLWSTKARTAAPPARAGHPCWVKRGDACAQSAGDVRYVENAALLPEVIDDFAARGIEEVVICDHAEGDLVKFYGVEGDPFFYFFYPTSGEHFSKFGLEAINGAPRNYHFDANALKQCADHTARCTQMPIYGGDCIVRPDGSWVIIDFNDWPSFSLCCEEAATAIARHVAFRP